MSFAELAILERGFERSFEQIGNLGRRLSGIGNEADRLFVAWAAGFEDAFLAAAHEASMRAVGVIPLTTKKIAKAVEELAVKSERAAEGSDNVVIASVPAAAHRTANIVRDLGIGTGRRAQHTVAALFGSPLPVEEKIDAHYQAIGRNVAMLVREGLDAMPLSRRIQAHAHEIRNLERQQRKRK